MALLDLVQTFAGLATAAGIFLAWWQIRLTKRQALTDFEDGLAREYRQIAESIPVPALLGVDLSDKEFDTAFARFFRYVDLCNEQVFLRMNGRISQATWLNWVDGMQSNLARPAFARAWTVIKTRPPGSFEELRRLEDEGFAGDPRGWVTHAAVPVRTGSESLPEG